MEPDVKVWIASAVRMSIRISHFHRGSQFPVLDGLFHISELRIFFAQTAQTLGTMYFVKLIFI